MNVQSRLESRLSDEPDRDHLLELTATIVSAHVAANTVGTDALPSLISAVYQTLTHVGNAEIEPVKVEPAVPVKRSVFGDHLLCIECGKSFKTIRRHLSLEHGLAPEAYRAKWGLPNSYPIVAPDYAAKRSELARSIGLGRKQQELPVASKPEVKVTKIAEVRRRNRK